MADKTKEQLKPADEVKIGDERGQALYDAWLRATTEEREHNVELAKLDAERSRKQARSIELHGRVTMAERGFKDWMAR